MLIICRYVPSSASFASVDDGAVPGTLVALVVVSDKDVTNGVTSTDTKLSISDGNELNHFQLVKLDGMNVARIEVRA